MAIVTINGQFGSAREVGAAVARLLEAGYVDRLILEEAAKRIGATVEALTEREQHPQTFGDRLVRTLENLLERSAMAGTAGDPDFGLTGMEAILSRSYEEMVRQPITRAQELDDSRFIQATTEVIRDLARGGNVVIVGRGSNIILKDTPGALHVGMIAPLEKRLRAIMEREHLTDRSEAESMIQDTDRARVDFFHKFFKVHPDDPSIYDLVINMERMDVAAASSIIAHAALRQERWEKTAGSTQ